jgi:hypothetical protein
VPAAHHVGADHAHRAATGHAPACRSRAPGARGRAADHHAVAGCPWPHSQ